MDDGVVIKIKSSVETEGALVVACFPSVGMVSSIVAHYLIDTLKLTFVGGVSHPKLPPLCLVQDGAPLPPIRIYAGQPICNVEGCDNLILIMSELQIPDPLVNELVNAMFEWSKSAKTASGILLDAFAKKGLTGGPEINSEPMIEYEDTEAIDILGIGATPRCRKMLKKMGILLVEQGVLRNMTGVFLGEGRRRGLDIMAILAEADPRFPDARAAAELISHLNELLPAVELDQAPLIEEAERLEEQLKMMMETHLSSAESDEPSASTSSMLYG